MAYINGKEVLFAPVNSGGSGSGGSGGIDTSDATATAADVAAGKTFYAGGSKKTGTMPEHSDSDFDINVSNGDSGELKIGYAASKKTYFNASAGALLGTIHDVNFIAGNIKKDKSIFGVVGTYEGEGGTEPNLGGITVTATADYQNILPEDYGLDGFDEVIVNPINSGGAELNIAYGDTAPEDTSKLWVKTTKPSAVKVAKDLNMVITDDTFVTSLTATRNSQYACSAQVGYRLYIFGGNNGNYTTEIFYFDTEEEVTTTLSVTMPALVCGAVAAAYGTKIYIFSGAYNSPSSSNEMSVAIYCFDTRTERIEILDETLPTGFYYHKAASYGKYIYIFGGSNKSGYQNTIIRFNAEEETVSILGETLPTGAMAGCCISTETSAYWFNPFTGGQTNIIWKFDFATEKFSILSAVVPKTVHNSFGCYFNGNIFLYIGQNIYCFSPENETFTALNATLTNSKANAHIAVTEEKMYIVGGQKSSSGADTAIYSVTVGMIPVLSADTLQVQSVLDKNIFYLINTDAIKAEIGVKKVYKGNAMGVGEEVEAALYKGLSWVTI